MQLERSNYLRRRRQMGHHFEMCDSRLQSEVRGQSDMSWSVCREIKLRTMTFWGLIKKHEDTNLIGVD